MTPECWQKVRDVLHEALQLAPEQRSGFLDRVCPADDPLRSDVESLLRSSDNVDSSFLQAPPIHLMLKRGTKLGDYEVESLLGFGGMGEVYRARDLRLHRNVAIKVLPSCVSLDPDRLHRFEQEARAAAALNHPNIIAVFQLGSYQGSPYLVSELLEGLTLREHLRHGPLELDKAIDYCSQIADGLAAAHSKGIVHRDLKPENLILTPEERVKILDFGLAKLISPPVKVVTLDVATDPGTVMGTLGYMSPEQALGKNLDLRTDLFSLGAVLYEMVTGRRAFEGDSSAAVYDAILNRMPPSPRQQNPELPVQIENIIFKAIEKNRDLRYQVASEVRADLKRLKRDRDSGNTASTSAAADLKRRGTAKDTTPVLAQRRYQRRIAWMVSALALALVIAAVGRFLMKSRGQRTRAPWRPTTIAVLPFQNAAHDPKLDYLGTALPDEVITSLSYAPTLSVRPFSMSQQFTSQNSDPHQAGRQLQVSDVVTGHYIRRSDRLTVTLEAMDIVKNEMVWRASVEVGVNDMLGLREELTSALQKGLLPSLGASGNELSSTKPKSQEAYELYLRSQDSAYWSVARNKDGIALLERSLSLDPGYAPAWLALGAHYYNEADMVTGDEETFRKCVAAFERAHQLDPNLLGASTWLIGTRRVYGDLAVSFMQVQELAQKRPRRAEVHLLFAQLLRSAGAHEQAAHECEITHQLDPDLWTDCFVLYIYMGDFVRARHEMDRSAGEFSSFILGHVLLREGKIEEAMPRLKILAPGGDSNYDTIRDCLPDSSTTKCAAAVERSEKGFLNLPDPDAWYFGAALFAFLGRSDASIRLLDADIKHSFCFYPSVDHDPLFDKIRRSAEFKTARQAGIECQRKFARYTSIQFQ